jgi:hypothetical protein
MIWCLYHMCDYNDCDCNRYSLCHDCNIYLTTADVIDAHEHHDVEWVEQ